MTFFVKGLKQQIHNFLLNTIQHPLLASRNIVLYPRSTSHIFWSSDKFPL